MKLKVVKIYVVFYSSDFRIIIIIIIMIIIIILIIIIIMYVNSFALNVYNVTINN